jgi:outer membrane biosynthesis protein TonB
MKRQHPDRQQAGYHHDPRFGRLVLASLGVHLAVVLLFSGGLMPRVKRDLRPVYHVDLVNLPVMNPQAGRPDAQPESAKSPAKPAAPEPVKVLPKPEVKPEAVKVKKPEPAKPPIQPKKPVAAPKPSPKEPTYDKTLSAIEDLRRRQEIEALKQQLAQLGSKDTRKAAVPGAPAGMVDGKGTEAGSSYDAWLHEYLKQAWTLSRYQVSSRDLRATVKLTFDAQGNLLDYKFIEKSREQRFDESVRKAILQLKKLPNPPGSRMEKDIVFNLKDLLE